jgi:uncharacterized protein (DUF1697 family)
MQAHHQKYIALLRGINVGGHNKIPMAELRSLCAQNGLEKTESYIQSGNLVFTSPLTSTEVASLLEQAINQHFGFSIPVIVRAATQWSSIVAANPFPGASDKEPNLVMLGLSKGMPLVDARQELLKYAKFNERVEMVDKHLWIHFPEGSGRSKITPAVLDRVTGSVVTMRNWRTVQKLSALVG